HREDQHDPEQPTELRDVIAVAVIPAVTAVRLMTAVRIVVGVLRVRVDAGMRPLGGVGSVPFVVRAHAALIYRRGGGGRRCAASITTPWARPLRTRRPPIHRPRAI